MKTNKYSRKQPGFTLVELAMVLVIFGLLIAGLLSPLSTQVELRRTQETEAILEEAKEALLGYALVNKFLPCPDVNAIPSGAEGVRNVATDECAVLEGVLPWQLLGVRGQDAWGRYIRYRVSTKFTDNLNFFELTNIGNITVKSDTGTLASNVVAVVASHGPNGFGGINTVQASPDNQMPAPAGADEVENANSNNIFISHTPTPQGSANEFDDSVNWISVNILMNRMVSAGQLP
ncbi:type II secretion system protein [Methylotenera sp. G11]|uniref:type II secretion system protein n=1 Tax=Methylotenera sp. G11 TaxID=1506585 RepID=UPI000646F74F|nr:type II secretion system protein [Methylotenera sp. G11]